MTDQELKDEMRQEMIEEKYNDLREEMLRETYHERMMCEDIEYALEYVADDMDEAYHLLLRACKLLSEYGYDFTPVGLLKEM